MCWGSGRWSLCCFHLCDSDFLWFLSLTHADRLFVFPRALLASGLTAFGGGVVRLTPSPEERALGGGLQTETVRSPAASLGVKHQETQGPGVSGSGSPELSGTCPRSRHPGAWGWAAARLRLWLTFPLHQDRPGDACGHLEEGRPLGTRWGGRRGWGQELLRQPRTLWSGPWLPPRGLAGGAKWGIQDAEQPESP